MSRRAASNRKRIIDAAYQRFYRHGFSRVTMDDIAEAAGVAKRTLYAHFDSKDVLLASVLEQHHALAMERIEKWGRQLSSNTPEAIASLFAELADWGTKPRWSGAGFTRIVMELADLPGHPALKIAKQHKAAVEAHLSAALGSERAGAELALLLEGAMALMLVHKDRRYAFVAAQAAASLVCKREP